MLLLVALISFIVSTSVALIMIEFVIKPKTEKERPIETYKYAGVLRENKVVNEFSVVTNYGNITLPIKGKVNILTPQYLRCPDICHLESIMMYYVMTRAVEEGFYKDIVFITIDVDPWRDTLENATKYQKRIMKDLYGKITWIWILDDVDKMFDVYDRFKIYVKRDKETGLIIHFGGFIVIDKNGVWRYTIVPTGDGWNRPYDVAKILYEKVKKLVSE